MGIADMLGAAKVAGRVTADRFRAVTKPKAPNPMVIPADEAEHEAWQAEESYDFDVIIVGAGIAGSVCATELAREGYEVLLIDRGAQPGAKNLSGGVLYSRVMDSVFPNFAAEAPIERVITRNSLMFLNESSALAVDAWDAGLAEPINAVSVLRGKLDPWLAEQAEEAGATLMPGIRVDELVFSDKIAGQVIGVRAGEDVLTAKVVVAADGANAFLARQAGMRRDPQLAEQALGIKSTIKLSDEHLRDRFRLSGDEGAAYAVVGEATCGLPGGGFIYTNKESVSIGVVVRLDALKESELASSDIHDRFLSHPAIAPLIEGGELLEYGCHLVNEGGQAMMDGLIGPGFVSIGDAAGLTLNTGFTIRGMDFAAGSAIVAARAIRHALIVENYSRNQLRVYTEELRKSWVGQDMATYASASDFFDSDLLYTKLGPLASDVFRRLYAHDGTPRRHIGTVAREAVAASGVSITELARLGYKALRSL